MTQPLIDTAGIAQVLGLSRAYVTDELTKRPDFPAPIVNRSRRLRRWDSAEVMRWATDGRRSDPPSPGSTSAAAAPDPGGR
jgi:predicted DNA-binding transcriptional regulator AlpA